MQTFGWRARFVEDLPHEGMRLHLMRGHPGEPGGMTFLAYEAHQVDVVEAGSDFDVPRGLLLPAGAYAAIVEAVDPAPHNAEVRRLEEALALERRRVDDLLQATLRERTS